MQTEPIFSIKYKQFHAAVQAQRTCLIKFLAMYADGINLF
jgi:hypothetical protein